MAIETLPDEEREYIPDESDDTGSDGNPLDPSVAPDDDPNVSVPDEVEVQGEQLEDAVIIDDDQFDPIGSGSDRADDPTPIYQRQGDFIALDVPLAEQAAFDDEGDLYSAATGAPDDDDWAGAPDASTPVARMAVAPVAPDFEIEIHGEPEEEAPAPQPVQYEIQGKSDVAAWHTLAMISAQSMDAEVAGLPTSENWIFRIRAIYEDGYVGPWSAETIVDLPQDLMAPPVPSTPTLVAERGVITVQWDGSTASGLPQPPDYKHTAVWVSTSGEVGTWTIAGLLFADGGYLPYTFATYNVPHYFSLSSRDIVGNESARSAPAMATLKPMIEELEFQEIIKDWDAKWDGVITEAEQLSQKLDSSLVDIEAAEEALTNFRGTELPALLERLDTASSELEALGTQLGGELSAAKKELEDHARRLTAAQAAADKALLMAPVSTAAPTTAGGAGRPVNTIWTRIDGAGDVVGSWRWTGSAWVPMELTTAVIPKLAASHITTGILDTARLNTDAIAAATAAIQKADIKNLTVSNGTFSSAVIEKLWADVITARKIYANQLMVGSGGNLIVDPFFTDSDLTVLRTTYANTTGDTGWYWTGSYWYSKSGLADGNHTFPLRSTMSGSVYDDITIEPGARYRIRWEGFISGSSAATRAALRVKRRDGSTAYIGVVPSPGQAMAAGWATYTNEWEPGANDISFCPEIQFTSVVNVTRLALRNPSIVAMTDGSLIVNGSVDAKAINSQSVSAEVAKFINLDVSRLVSSSAKISEAVIEKLWTEVIHSRKITTEMLAVGSFDNIIPNPNFEDNGAGWLHSSRGSFARGGTLGYWMSDASGYQRGIYSGWTSARSGDRYSVSASVSLPDETGLTLLASSIALYARWQNSAGSYTTVGLGNQPVSASASTLGHIRSEFEVPANAVNIRFGFYVQSNYVKRVRFQAPQATRIAGATLIADGAIVTEKLAANSVKVGNLAANAVTAEKIHGEAIDGKVITGATMRTNSAGTGIIINNSGIEGRTAAGRKFFLSALTGELEAIGSITTGVDSTFRAKLSNRDGIAALDIYSAGGDAAHHAALIAWDDQVALRRYVNRTSYKQALNMAPTFTSLTDGSGGQLYFGSTNLELLSNKGARTYLGSRRAILEAEAGSKLDFTSSQVILAHASSNSDILVSRLYNGAMHFISPMIEATTTTGGANINVNAGFIRKTTSASKYKLFPKEFDDTLDDKLLSIGAKHWIDKTEAEETTELMRPETLDEATDPGLDEAAPAPNPMRRVPGVIAEEVRDAGLDEFVVYDANGEVEGVMYDRLGVALIPVVKRQRDRITQLESQMAQLLARVEALEAA